LAGEELCDLSWTRTESKLTALTEGQRRRSYKLVFEGKAHTEKYIRKYDVYDVEGQIEVRLMRLIKVP